MKKQLLRWFGQPIAHKQANRFLLLTLFSFLVFHASIAQQWSILGNESQVSAAAATFTSIALKDDVPYIVYREGSIAKVKRKNAISGNWEQVGNEIGNGTFTRIILDKTNRLYVTYLDAANGTKLAVKIYNDETNAWEPLNNDINNLYVSAGSVNNNVSQYSSTPRSSLAFDSDNSPYIAFGEGTNLVPTVKKFDGITWTTVGGGPVNTAAKAVGLSLIIDEADIPWLVYVSLSTATSSTGAMALYQFSGGLWTAIVVPSPVPGGSASTGPTTSIRHTSMALNATNNLTIVYFNTGNSNRASVSVYNKTAGTWSYTGTLSGRDAPSISLIRDITGNLYCSFIDNVSSTPVYAARVFKQYTGTTTWRELKDPAVVNGIDQPTGNLTIAIGSDTASPYVVYTKNNSSSVSTPIVRKFIPPANPATLTTLNGSNFTATTVDVGGNITSDGGTAITQRGIVYGTAVNPTTANGKVVDVAAGLGSFTLTISGLLPATFYYARAYAINDGGTTYGNTVRLNTLTLPETVVTGPKQMEYLNRGLIAVRKNSTEVFIGWRLLGNDPAAIAFNLYRDGVKLNTDPITSSTNYLDANATNGSYTVRPILNGVEGTPSNVATVWANNQLSIPLQIPPGGTTPDGVAYTYTANDCSAGDVDGDGEYEIFLKWDPTKLNDNAGGYSGDQIIDCYKLDGTRLWRINLGKNLNAGPHFTQFMVYDFDGDGKAEMACKTADGTMDGLGVVIGDANVDYRSSAGWVDRGSEFLTVFNGLTGAAMATIDYLPARGAYTDWGDNYGNRAERYVSAVAYLDGTRPSLVVGRGYYNKLVRAAYDWRNGQLTLRWLFDSKNAADPNNEVYSGQGNHQMTIGDVDGDGKDEVINGSCVINDDGTRLWSNKNGHGDALHMSDMDPDRPGQEIWMCHESPSEYSPLGLRLNDAKTGQTIFGAPTTGDVGRGLAADIDPNHRGYEMWGSSGNLYNVQDGQIGTAKPTNGSQAVNHLVWWDGDLGRELLDGTILDKWNPTTQSLNRVFTIYNAASVSSNNSTKKNPGLTADLMGDWREEIILRKSDNTALILFTTNILTDKRIYTLMHDPQYRTAIAWQNSGYNQPPHPGFFLGYDMEAPPVPNIEVKFIEQPLVNNITTGTRVSGCDTTLFYTAEASGYPAPVHTYVLTGETIASGDGTGSGQVFNLGTTHVAITATNSSGTIQYGFDVIVEDQLNPVVTATSEKLLCYNETSYTVPAIIATDNCGIATIAYSITGATERNGTGADASGNFEVGVSTITWTVTDIHNLQTTASTTVTVNPLFTANIPDVYAVNQQVDNKNTLYIGYGPTSLTINAIANGGTAPYTYAWSSGQTTSSISVSTAGIYTAIITDAKGCTTVASITIFVVDATCGNNSDKVMMCHNGSIICVAANAVQSHLNHGDLIGTCTPPSSITTSATMVHKPTIEVNNEVSVYPNPSAGQFNVILNNFKTSKRATLIVMNLNGQVISQKEVPLVNGHQITRFNLTNKANSMYLLKVVSADGVRTQKIVVGD